MTTLLSTVDSNTTTIEAQSAIAPATGTVVSLSLYIAATSTGPDSIELGLYTDDGGVPEALIASTASVVDPPAGAWLTLPVPAVTVSAGTPYWLAYEVSGPSVNYLTDSVSGVAVCSTFLASYGTMPAQFPGPADCSGFPWSFYATIQP
ncbi:MAG: hypothetical protein JST54_16610 [Deltaproteobacteria bacterium]|nr:hypothetical protein [Deltaproteobacteria bacterium]